MFDTLLNIALFLLASLRVCLLSLRLSINIKHLCLYSSISFITDINGFFEIPNPPSILTPPPQFIKFNKNLRPP